MTRKILLALLCCSVGLSGCERLSEKEKLETERARLDTIAFCDSEARKKFQEDFNVESLGSSQTELITHYSFQDKKCYALEKRTLSLRSGYESYRNTLYDGLTKQELGMTTCSVNSEGNECLSGGGFSTGIPEIEGAKNAAGLVSYVEGMKVIDARMSKP